MPIFHKSWFGLDASLEISLIEYGWIAQENKDGVITVVYLQNPHDFCYKSRNFGELVFSKYTTSLLELKEMANENWFNKKSVESYACIDIDTCVSPLELISSYLSYYGVDNIFGFSHAIKWEYVRKWLMSKP